MPKKNKKVRFNNLIRSKDRIRNLRLAFARVLSSGNFILGDEVRTFEKEFSSFLGAKYCIGVGNGQEALQISLMSLGVGIGDEVITTPISAVATTLSILSIGATPVFVDTNEYGQINVDLIKKAITKKTKAILPVHLYGNCADMDELKLISKKNNIFFVEDACQAHGASFEGKKLGTFGHIGCFSFYPTKNLGGFGDGGAIVTDSLNFAKICREIRDYGQKEKYIHSRLGLNSRLDELQAALLRGELKYLSIDNKKRKILAERYIENLKNSSVKLIENSFGSNYHLFVVKTKKRAELQKYLEKSGIQTSIHYPMTIPDQPFLKKDFGKVNIPVARKFVKEILSLPCNPSMNIKDVDYVCDKIKEFENLYL